MKTYIYQFLLKSAMKKGVEYEILFTDLSLSMRGY